MPETRKQTAAPHRPAVVVGPTLAQAIAVVRRGLALRAHLAAAGDNRKFRQADAVLNHWVMRIVAACAQTGEDIKLKREFVLGLDRYRFELDPYRRAMVDAVLAAEARRLVVRPLAH